MAGASSAISAGISYGVTDALGLNPMLDSNGTFIKDAQGNIQYGTAAASAYSKLPALDKLGDSLFWQQTGLNATAQGALGQLQGGSFQDSFTASLAASVGRTANTGVGDWAMKNDIAAGDWSKALLHAGIGAAQAQLTGQDAAAGAIGGATAELLAAANDSS